MKNPHSGVVRPSSRNRPQQQQTSHNRTISRQQADRPSPPRLESFRIARKAHGRFLSPWRPWTRSWTAARHFPLFEKRAGVAGGARAGCRDGGLGWRTMMVLDGRGGDRQARAAFFTWPVSPRLDGFRPLFSRLSSSSCCEVLPHSTPECRPFRRLFTMGLPVRIQRAGTNRKGETPDAREP